MITREDLEQAICECQAEREPNSSTCIKLAAFLTIKNYLYSSEEQQPNRYSYASEPDNVSIASGTEFAEAVNGMKSEKAWALMDELMSTLQVINPRLYDGVMRRIKSS